MYIPRNARFYRDGYRKCREGVRHTTLNPRGGFLNFTVLEGRDREQNLKTSNLNMIESKLVSYSRTSERSEEKLSRV